MTPELPTIHQTDGGMKGHGSEFVCRCEHCTNWPICRRFGIMADNRTCQNERLGFTLNPELAAPIVPVKSKRKVRVKRKDLYAVESYTEPEERPGEGWEGL